MKQVYLFLMTILIMSCSKNKNDDGTGGGINISLSESDLAGSAGKQWDISYLKITYYNSSGGIDSTVSKGGGVSDVAFFGTTVSGAQYYATDPLNQFIPATGIWNLGVTQKTVKFTCSSPGCSTTETWQIESYSPRNAYGESLHMMQQQSLGAGRSRLLKTRLYKQ